MNDLRVIAAAFAAAESTRANVVAVILTGSVARGEETPSSDVDLVVVTSEDVGVGFMRRDVRDGALVECVTRSEAEWRECFYRPVPRWVYAFIEGEILRDDGAGKRLVREAQQVRSSYKTPHAVLEEMAAAFWDGQAKVDRAVASEDPAARGYQASVAVDWIIDALYALHNIPLPAASRRFDYIGDVPLDPEMKRDWRSLLAGDVDERITANARLQARIRDRLPDPRLEVV